MIFFNKRAQGLPLNTVVIAILAIITLLVIVVMFSGKFSESSDQLSEVSGCSLSNPLVKTKYEKVFTVSGVMKKDISDASCSSQGGNAEYVSFAPPKYDEEKKTYTICCGVKKDKDSN
jgi:hypothetical protein